MLDFIRSLFYAPTLPDDYGDTFWIATGRRDGKYDVNFLGKDMGVAADWEDVIELVLAEYHERCDLAIRMAPKLGEPGGPLGMEAPRVRVLQSSPSVGSAVVLRFPSQD